MREESLTMPNQKPRRVRRILSGAFTAVLLVAVGFGARGLIATPEEAAVLIPEPVAIFAQVQARPVSTIFSGAGEISVANASDVIAVANSQSGISVVSKTPLTRSDEVQFCKPLIEISGRPLFALQGDVLAYRDLTEGDSGSDVKQLQQSLKNCGYNISADGKFGAQTTAAVRKLYKDSGYLPQELEIPPEVNAVEEDSEITSSNKPSVRVIFPHAEVAFLIDAGWVASVAPINHPVDSEPIMTIDHGELHYRAEFPAAVKLAITPGEMITIDLAGTPFDVEIPELPIVPTVTENGEAVFPIEITLPPEVNRELAGTNQDYVIVIGDDITHPLVVPASALYSRANGTTVVLRKSHEIDEHTTEVTVETIASGGGYVAIEGDLKSGDYVQVGTQ